MNVLYVTNTLHRGGAEAHLLLLATGLRARGHHCEVAFLRSSVEGGSFDLRPSFEHAGIRTHYLDCERSYDPRIGIRLNRVLASRPWHVLHSHLPRADAAAAMCKRWNRRQAWIATLHHPYDNAYSGARLVPVLAPMWRRADGIIAVSEMVRRWAIDRLKLPAGSVRTIPHGLDSQPRPHGGAPLPAAPRHCIGSIGRYEERKGHETLIRAMAIVLKEFPDARLIVAGHDPWGYGGVLQRLIDEMGLRDHVQLIGFMSDKESFFSQIDIFAFASLSEGFGIVLLEAMAEAKPAVVSNFPPLNEILTPGVTGLVAERDDPADFARAIITLFRDQDTMRRMGDAGRERVRSEFSTERMVDRTLAFYKDIVASGTAVRA